MLWRDALAGASKRIIILPLDESPRKRGPTKARRHSKKCIFMKGNRPQKPRIFSEFSRFATIVRNEASEKDHNFVHGGVSTKGLAT